MRIASLAARTVRWPITGEGAARGRVERAAVLVEVRSDRGAIGLGEAAPLPGMSLDTLDDAERAIAAIAARAPFDVLDRDAAFALARGAVPSARFAIETALLDVLARDRGVTLAALLGPPTADEVRVPLAAVVDDPASARWACAAGVRCLKIKLDAGDDIARAFAIAAAAPRARLRIDANRSWPRSEVAARMAALARLPIDYVEEPCAAAHLLAAEPLPCKIALDESLALIAPEELRVALRGPRLAALVLKPTVLGGLAATLDLAKLARAAGVAAIVSHGLEGPIGTAACAELALALGGEHPAGLALHAALVGWRLAVPQVAADHVHRAVSPGLGFAGIDLSGACSRVAAIPGGDR